MQVLIVKISSMGDVLHTLPALTDAMRAIPSIHFDWVIEENFAQIPTWHPAVRKVIPIAIRRWRKNWFGKTERQERYKFKHQLQRDHYNIIIDAQGLIKSVIFVTSVANGEKHGLDYKSACEPLTSWFYHRRHNVSKQQHAVERIRQLFAASLNYQLPSVSGDYAISSYFPYHPVNETYLMFLHATTHFDKHWPEKYWRMLIQLVSKSGYRVKLCWGTTHECLRAYRLAKGFSTVEVLSSLTLTQLALQLSGATATVSVDTGLSHLAAAMNCPNITLYGPTNPKLIGGYGRYQQSLQAVDGNMQSITVERVWQLLQPLLAS